MIPLSLGPGGLCVGRRNGRSGWLCERQACLNALVERPSSASRSFRARVSLHPHLIDQIQAWRAERHRHCLRAAHRSGLLVVLEADDAAMDHGCDLWVMTRDHEGATSDQIKLNKKGISTYIMAIDSGDISAIIGPRRCTLLGIRPGRATQSLLESLRRWDSLG